MVLFRKSVRRSSDTDIPGVAPGGEVLPLLGFALTPGSVLQRAEEQQARGSAGAERHRDRGDSELVSASPGDQASPPPTAATDPVLVPGVTAWGWGAAGMETPPWSRG